MERRESPNGGSLFSAHGRSEAVGQGGLQLVRLGVSTDLAKLFSQFWTRCGIDSCADQARPSILREPPDILFCRRLQIADRTKLFGEPTGTGSALGGVIRGWKRDTVDPAFGQATPELLTFEHENSELHCPAKKVMASGELVVDQSGWVSEYVHIEWQRAQVSGFVRCVDNQEVDVVGRLDRANRRADGHHGENGRVRAGGLDHAPGPLTRLQRWPCENRLLEPLQGGLRSLAIRCRVHIPSISSHLNHHHRGHRPRPEGEPQRTRTLQVVRAGRRSP